MSEHPWMEHDITGHRAQLPDDPYWRANGWHPVDGPHPEPDTLHDPGLHDQPEPEPEPEPEPAKSAAKSKSTAKSEEK